MIKQAKPMTNEDIASKTKQCLLDGHFDTCSPEDVVSLMDYICRLINTSFEDYLDTTLLMLVAKKEGGKLSVFTDVDPRTATKLLSTATTRIEDDVFPKDGETH